MTDNVGKADLAQARKVREAMDDTLWFKPEKGKGNTWGKNYLRIFPPHISMDGSFYWGVPLHFGLGPGKLILPCPRRGHNQTCPACTMGFDLKTQGQDQAFKDLMPSWQAYLNVLVLNSDGSAAEDPPKLRIWSAGKKLLDMLLDEFEESGDFTDLKTGRDVEVRRRGEKFETEYRIKLDPNPSETPYADLASELRDLSQVSPWGDNPQGAILQALEAGPAEGGDPWKGDAPAVGTGQAKEPDQVTTGAERWGDDDGSEDTAEGEAGGTQEAARERLKQATKTSE